MRLSDLFSHNVWPEVKADYFRLYPKEKRRRKKKEAFAYIRSLKPCTASGFLDTSFY
jgi:hypothetical protein